MSALGLLALKTVEKKAVERLVLEGEKQILKNTDLKYSRLSNALYKLATKGEALAPRIIKEVKSRIDSSKKKDDYIEPVLKDSEIAFGGSIEREFPWAGAIGGYSSVAELSSALIKSEAENELLKIERHPAKLPADIAKRLVDMSDVFSAEAWAKGSLEDRLEMLNEAYKIIAEEACIPQEVIDSGVVISLPKKPEEQAAVNIFVNATEDGKIYQDLPIVISFNESNLMDPKYNFHDALSSLYHEVVHVMQQQSLCEGGNTFVYAEMQNEWREDVLSTIRKNPVEFNKSENRSDYIDYISSPMETYAHMQTDYFTKVLVATEIDAGSDNVTYLYDAVASAGGAGDISFGKLITVPEELTGYTHRPFVDFKF